MTAQARDRRVLFLGGLSAMGEAAARLFAAEGARIGLIGRNGDRLHAVARDLKARGAVACHVWEADLVQGPTPSLDMQGIAAEMGGPIDVCVLVYGVLGDHEKAQKDLSHAREFCL